MAGKGLRGGCARRDAILKHALDLFAEQGYRETNLQDVASRLGITREALYYYFDSKEAILWSLVERAGHALLEQALPVVQSSSPADDKLSRLLGLHVRWVLQNRATYTVYFSERDVIEGERNRMMREAEHAYVRLVAGLLREGQQTGAFLPLDATTCAMLMLGLCNSTLRWFRTDGPLTIDQIADEVVAVARVGVVSNRMGNG